MSAPVGITTTVPVEILLAAGRSVVDLNNLFVAGTDASALVARAEQAGFPQSGCAWIKGIYGTIHARGIRDVVGVIEGDCSDTSALLEILESEGVTVHPFAFPHARRADDLLREMERLAADFDTALDTAEAVKRDLDAVRAIARDIDELAFQSGTVASAELFDHLLLLSDFGGDIPAAQERLTSFLETARARTSESRRIRLGCVGVPTILSDLWDSFERAGARFVYHEVPRQFALIPHIGTGLVESYRAYTYPYDMAGRLVDIKQACTERRLDGIVHYVQSFCHRQIHDRLLREGMDLPILTIEGDRPGPVDERTRTRIEAFCEQLGG